MSGVSRRGGDYVLLHHQNMPLFCHWASPSGNWAHRPNKNFGLLCSLAWLTNCFRAAPFIFYKYLLYNSCLDALCFIELSYFFLSHFLPRLFHVRWGLLLAKVGPWTQHRELHRLRCTLHPFSLLPLELVRLSKRLYPCGARCRYNMPFFLKVSQFQI